MRLLSHEEAYNDAMDGVLYLFGAASLERKVQASSEVAAARHLARTRPVEVGVSDSVEGLVEFQLDLKKS